MNNNIGVIDTILSKVIGEINYVNIDETYINIISGELGVGFMVFDDEGTMAICTNITTDANDNTIYQFTTSVTNADVDVNTLLSEGY